MDFKFIITFQYQNIINLISKIQFIFNRFITFRIIYRIPKSEIYLIYR